MKAFLWVRSRKGAIAWSAVLLLPLLLRLLNPVMVLWSILLLLFLSPWGVCTAYLTGGALPALAGVLGSTAAGGLCFGVPGAAAALLLTGAPFAVYLYLCEKNIPFGRSAAVMTVTYAAMGAILVLAARLIGGMGLYDLAANAAVTAMRGMGQDGDILLGTLQYMGLIGENVPGGGLTQMLTILNKPLSEETREPLLRDAGVLTAQYVLALLPVYLAGQSVFAGIGSIALGQHYGRKSRAKRGVSAEEEPLPSMDMPPLRRWYIPKGWGAAIGLLASGYLFQTLFVNSIPMQLCGAAFASVFSACYMIQGIALLNELQHARGVQKGWRVAVPILLAAAVPFMPVLMGIIDQWKDIRGLRKTEPEKEEKEL